MRVIEKSLTLVLSDFSSLFCFFARRRKGLVNYTDLRTVKQLAQEAPFVTESSLRWWIYHANSNGFDTVLIKIGGRVYIDKNAFNRWLEGQRLAASEGSAA